MTAQHAGHLLAGMLGTGALKVPSPFSGGKGHLVSSWRDRHVIIRDREDIVGHEPVNRGLRIM